MNGIDEDLDDDIVNNIDEIEGIIEDDDPDLIVINETIEIKPGRIYIPDDLCDLPGQMEIFAITLTGSINSTFNIQNILNYYPLDPNNFSTIKSKIKIRTIIKKKQTRSTKINLIDKINEDTKDQDNFFNQITVVMSIPIDYESTQTKLINLKLFNNGSIQVSGLKSISQCNIMINKLIELLKGEYCVFINPDGETCKFDTPGAISKIIRFLEFDTINLTGLKISMINTMFQYTSKINRSQLYMRLMELKINGNLDPTTRLKYQPDIHAPVHVKIDLGNKKPVTVFVFESGKILIMAAKRRDNIIGAYNYINQLLHENHEYVVKRNLVEIIANDPDLCKLIDLEALSQVFDDL
jgi:TATA-box binding protein (TBP) (component of TFIID and TFIIIB)